MKRASKQRKVTTGSRGIRKEFVFVGAAVAVFVVLIVVSHFMNAEKHYKGDNVSLSFDPDADTIVSGNTDVGDYDIGDFTGYDPDAVFDLPSDAAVFDGDYEPVMRDSDDLEFIDWFYAKDGILYDEDGNSYGSISDYVSDFGETITEDGKVVDSSGRVVAEIEVKKSTSSRGRPTAEQYANMVVHYVCGVEDELFDKYLSSDLKAGFGQYTSVEPYSTLNGQTSFKVNEILDNSMSFTVNSVKYTFEVSFDGDVVTGVRYAQ